jgi:hypothetical protein
VLALTVPAGTPIARCIGCNPGPGDDAPISYERHEPEKTLLYHVVREHLERLFERSEQPWEYRSI